jgi:hypothetical protein
MDQEEKEQQLVWDILSTPNDILHIAFRKKHKLAWLTKDRRILLIKNMETTHIISCINMLERAGQERTQAYEGLIEELKKRGHDGVGLE